jgi:hypothetical protein
MGKFPWVPAALALVFCALGVVSASAQKVEASVLNRQTSDTDYAAVIPGFSNPGSQSAADCTAATPQADCAANIPSNIGSGELTYNVTGTTLALLLPDGRVAVVNCVSKYSPKGNYINRRTCGMPLVPSVQAEFKGKNARLEWPIGSNGKKTESETYKIVAMLEKK